MKQSTINNQQPKAHQRLLACLQATEHGSQEQGLVYYHIGRLLLNTEHYEACLHALDECAKIGFIDTLTIDLWLNRSISHPQAIATFPTRLSNAFNLAPDDLWTKGIIANYGMIYSWMMGDVQHAYQLAAKFHQFKNLPERDEQRHHAQLFFSYMLYLFVFWQKNPSLYNNIHITDAKNKSTIKFIGESHSLSPTNTFFRLGKNSSIAQSHFVTGIKMWHLSQPKENSYKAAVRCHYESIHNTDTVVFSIGEIDCRPNEGIWKASEQGKASTTNSIILDTVKGYIAFIADLSKNREIRNIIIQGVPAPGYALTDKHDPVNKEAFLLMIKDINNLLKTASLDAGFQFLDIYSATANDELVSNQQWHLDGFHLKPSFYQQAQEWLVQ